MRKFVTAAGRKISRILSIFGAIILLALISLTVYIMVCNARGSTAQVFGLSIMKVVSGSMEPSIHKGDYLLIKKTDTDSLKVGDIICFYSEDEEIYGMPNTHRIIAISEDGFETKGDANSVADSTLVSPDRVIGIYSGKVRILRWINSFASGRKLIMVAVIIPMLLIAAFEVKSIARIKAEADEEDRIAAESEKERLIREAIDREKARLYEENYRPEQADTIAKEAVEDDSGKDNES
jgi:signal peptidase I